MYVKVPEHLKTPILAELKQLKLRSSLKYFPVLVLIFSAIVALIVLVKGFGLLRMLIEYANLDISNTKFIIISLSVIVCGTTAVLAFFLWQGYRDCDCQECLYCSRCDAVDKYDDGVCPVCKQGLTEKASFFFTTAKDEQKIIERWGLHRCRDA
jgi:hypothetical protein